VLDEEYHSSIPSTIFDVQRRKLVLKNGDMFLLTTESGNIVPPSPIDLGLFYKDTRYLSHYCLCIGGIKPILLSSSSERNFFSQIEMTLPKIIRGEEKKRIELPKNSVHIRRSQILSNETFFDFIDINNYSTYEFTVPLRLQFFFDFFDMFEVRGLVKRIKKGKYLGSLIEDSRVLSSYIGLDGLTRRANIIFSSKPDQLEETSAKWYVTLKPRKTFSLRVCIKLDTDVCNDKNKIDILREENASYENWIYSLTKIETSNETLQDTINRGIFDLKSLTSMENGLRIIHAGIPWFSVPFGRDSIITSLQTLMLSPEIAKENLLYLASRQGKEVNEFNEEEPGKILHEYRYGELANGREIPHIPYYGSIDATPLYLIAK
ncbi:MAG: glycogen debranching N-terminal domain-containing protein, partial [Methanosarcinales archaeon]